MTAARATGAKPPAGLGRAGRALWRDIAAEFELDVRELAVLAAACRQADDVARLEALIEEQGAVVTGSAGQPKLSPAFAEVRQGRLALGRLLGDLALPNDTPTTARSSRARRAAEARWRRHDREQERRAGGA